MKFKYFLRGLGLGIIFASIVCLTAYQGNSPKDMSDAEIKRRAKELGMVEQEDKIGDLLEKNNENNQENVDVENETTEQVSTTEQISTSESSEESGKTTKKVTETNSTEEKKKQESTTENQTNAEKQPETEEETIKITVERGSSSFPVCQKLQELGMIEDANDFDTYLVKNGYASRIRVGEHTLKRGMSYHDIAEAISDPL